MTPDVQFLLLLAVIALLFITEYRDYFFPDVLRQPGMEHCCTDDEHAGK